MSYCATDDDMSEMAVDPNDNDNSERTSQNGIPFVDLGQMSRRQSSTAGAFDQLGSNLAASSAGKRKMSNCHADPNSRRKTVTSEADSFSEDSSIGNDSAAKETYMQAIQRPFGDNGLSDTTSSQHETNEASKGQSARSRERQ